MGKAGRSSGGLIALQRCSVVPGNKSLISSIGASTRVVPCGRVFQALASVRKALRKPTHSRTARSALVLTNPTAENVYPVAPELPAHTVSIFITPTFRWLVRAA